MLNTSGFCSVTVTCSRPSGLKSTAIQLGKSQGINTDFKPHVLLLSSKMPFKMWKSIKSAFIPSCIRASKAKKETVQPKDHQGEEQVEKPKRKFFSKKRFLSFFKRNKSAVVPELVVPPEMPITAVIPDESVAPEKQTPADQEITQPIEDEKVCWVFDIGAAAKPEGDLSELLASKNVDVLKDNYVAIGPYVNAQGITTIHLPADSPISVSVQKMRSEGHKVAAVQWNIPDSPPVILFDLRSQADADDRVQLFKHLLCRFFFHFNGEIKKKTIETGIEHSTHILRKITNSS